MTDEIDDWVNEVHQGDVREKLSEMPEESVDMVVTSPPYYGKRDYGGDEMETVWGGEDDCEHEWVAQSGIRDSWGNTEILDDQKQGTNRGAEDNVSALEKGSNYCSKCGAWKGQLGLEPSPIQFVQNLTEIFREVYRVLKPTGSFYLNLGDTYAGGGGISGVPDDWDSISTTETEKYPESVPARDVEFPDKCKMLIPSKTSLSLIEDGWICRNNIVWWKDGSAMPESVTDRRSTTFEFVFHFVKQGDYYYDLDSIREPYADSSKERYNYRFNETASSEVTDNPSVGGGDVDPNPQGKNPGDVQQVNTANYSGAHFAVWPPDLIRPHIKSSCPEDGIVLDPFIGSGTTAVVAEQLDRDWIGIDLNKDYVEMSYDRIDDETKRIFDDRSVFDL